MGLNRFLQFFIPKDSVFLPLLKAQADDLVFASELLVTFTRTQDHEDRKKIYAEIKKTEQHCDSITNQILDELNDTFITPFDREDIQLLASQCDDVLDLITASAKRTILYQPKSMPESMATLAEYIKESTESLHKAISELNKVKKDPSVVRMQCHKLHEIENLADDVYENFIISLFQHETDAIELLKLVEIVQLLESTTDKAYRVTDVLKTLIVKYA